MPECDVCGESFDSDMGVSVHKGRVHGSPLDDEEKLRELYVEEELSGYEIAERLDVGNTQVYKRLREYGIEGRSRSEAQGGPDFTEEQLRELHHEKGLYTTEIAEMFDIDPSNVTRWMQRLGVEHKGISGENHPDWKGGDLELECDYCSEPFTRPRSHYNESGNNFCSRVCMNNWKSENLTGENAPGWEGGKIELECEHCGDTFETWPFKSDRRFCSQSCTREWQSEEWVGENNPFYKGSHGDYCGPDWPEQREERLEIDGWECAICGKSNEEHKQEYGNGLHVHHIHPRRSFRDEDGSIDWDEANAPENLISLCVSCHTRWEGIPLAPITPTTGPTVVGD